MPDPGPSHTPTAPPIPTGTPHRSGESPIACRPSGARRPMWAAAQGLFHNCVDSTGRCASVWWAARSKRACRWAAAPTCGTARQEVRAV